MEISKAALPPRQPPISTADRAHPLFPLYQSYRSSMGMQLVEAPAFRDWLFQYEQALINERHAQHPRYEEFRAWMTTTKAGRRRCPAGFFPHNFTFFLNGGRW